MILHLYASIINSLVQGKIIKVDWD